MIFPFLFVTVAKAASSILFVKKKYKKDVHIYRKELRLGILPTVLTSRISCHC